MLLSSLDKHMGTNCFVKGMLSKAGGVLQVINAALALAAKPQSKLAQENMDLFKEQWEKQVRVLTDAVDDITSIDDFLAVSGNQGSRRRNNPAPNWAYPWKRAVSARVPEAPRAFGREGVAALHLASVGFCQARCENGAEDLGMRRRGIFIVWKQRESTSAGTLETCHCA